MADDTTDTDSDIDDTDAQNLLADALDTGTDTAPGTDDPAGQIQRLTADLERWKGLARKHEGRAKQNADAASKAKTVEDQLSELRTQIADRDVAQVERSGRQALDRVHTQLAEAGIKRDDVAGLLELVDPTVLLKDGDPNDEAITKLANSLAKVAGRVQPDHDQGRKGGSAPPNMNDLIRRAAGIRTS